ncbi:MAG: glycoside hydrolase family 1 protein [Patescibacteria group bacterium]
MIKFPSGFYWGAATSSHQIEGDNRNDWVDWEKKNAVRLAEEAKNKWQKWQQEKFPEMFKQENYVSGIACDHYNRFEEDFNIAKSLGHNTHRFSIEWSRIEPKEGVFDEKEIEHYRNVIKALKQRNIEPFITLWHFSLPSWFATRGGWQSKKSVFYFSRYAEKVVQEFGENVKFWITLNEPEIYTGKSYLKGQWPPQKKNLFTYFLVFKNLIKAHRAAYKTIKKINPKAEIGIAKNNIYFEAYNNNFLNKILKFFADWRWNFYFLNKIKNHQDFIGVNYYRHFLVNFCFLKQRDKRVSDMGWELYPEGIYYILKDLKKYNKPVYITENGLADADDKNREWFIKEILKNVYKAIKESVDVRGYFYWSLLDNFEWDKGFWPRFGLVEIDYKTMERKIRPSAWEYAKICKENKLKI